MFSRSCCIFLPYQLIHVRVRCWQCLIIIPRVIIPVIGVIYQEHHYRGFILIVSGLIFFKKTKMYSHTKLKLTFGFLVILSIILSIYARFTTQFPGDLYLTLHLQSIGNTFIISVLQGVSFISKVWYLILRNL